MSKLDEAILALKYSNDIAGAIKLIQAHQEECEKYKSIVKDLADWSNKYPKSRTYSFSHRNEIEGELERIEELAKKALEGK